VVDQRLAVIGERQRHQSAPGQPAFDSREDQPIRQRRAGRRRRVGDRLVGVCAPQGLEPAAGVKDAGVGVPLQELRPAGIAQGIESVNGKRNRYRPSTLSSTVSPARVATPKRACSFPSPSMRGLPLSETILI
jgi:hypothetical protein